MERILEYMSQQSWDSPSNSQPLASIPLSQPSEPEGRVRNCTGSSGNGYREDSNPILLDDREIFMTPESEDEVEADEDSFISDSDTSNNDDGSDVEENDFTPRSNYSNSLSQPLPGDQMSAENYSGTPSTPAYSPITPQLSELEETPLNWNWVTDTSFALSTSLPFTAEFRFADFPEGDDVELKYFEEFLTAEMVDMIVQQSNNYCIEVKNKSTRLSRRMRQFKPITSEDIWRMLAVRICMAVDQKPKQSHYWSKNPFYKSEIVPLIMTSDRYKDVHRFLHFCKNDDQDEGDRLYKIRELWELFNERLGLHCSPGKNICLDESLVMYKGNLYMKQYIPSKAAKVGIKLFSVADSQTGYILSVMIYEGKSHQLSYSAKEFGFGGAVVLELGARYFNFGRCLFLDNYFVNPRLARKLLDLNTNICGTLRKRLKCNPPMTDKIRKGEVRTYSSNGVLVERWRDKREVCMLSTGQNHHLINVRTRSGKQVIKPETVLAYNKYARAIDKMDMVTGVNEINRKCTKWYKKLFYKMVDICLYNANIIFGNKHGKIPILEFKERIVLQILRKYGEHSVKRGRKPSHTMPSRMNGQHFPEFIPATVKKIHPSRDCAFCRSRKTRHQTRYMCSNCNVALCIVPCFKNYHHQ